MKKFYVTFGQSHPLRDGYVVIEASNYDLARQAAFDTFSVKFCFVRSEEEIIKDYFPAGQIGKTIYA